MAKFNLLIITFLLIDFCFVVLCKNDNILIVVSYDAFRNEYFDRNVTDYMNDLRFKNTYSDYMRNVFPTKTFPNHHSIATGVYPEDHGVMANSLYDLDLNKELSYSFELFHYKSEIKPIWVQNEINGGISGCMMWPGSNFQYDNYKCTHTAVFNMSVKFNDRVDTLISWIKDSEKPANLVMFYIEEPDTFAHAFGVTSNNVTNFISQLNGVTQYLHDKLVEHNLINRTSVIHVSDHGMSDLQPKNIIDLRNFIGNDTASFYGTTPILQIVPKNGKDVNEIFNKLSNASNQNTHFKVYLNSNLPSRWNFNNKNRVGPITAVADMDYGFHDMFASMEFYKKAYNIPITPTSRYGVHGYDNIYELMHPMFFAYGNQIRTNNKVKPFDSVDLYYLFCEILKIPTPNFLKGNRENILSILKDNHVKRNRRLVIITSSLGISVMFVALVMWIQRILKRRREPGVPSYIYDETDTILDEQKLSASNYSSNGQMTSTMSNTVPSLSSVECERT